MARLNEFAPVVRAMGAKAFFWRVWQQTSDDDLFTLAAALAYSWMFAVFPFIIFLLTLTPLLPLQAKARAGLYMDAALGELGSAAAPLKTQVDDLLRSPRSGLLSIGLLLTIWAASNGVAMTMTALDRCYDIRKGRQFVQQRLVALMLTIIVTVLLLAVMLLLPVGSIAIAWCKAQGLIVGPVVWLLNAARLVLALLVMLAILALVYYFGPSLNHKFHAVTPGAIFCVAVWVVLAFSFRMYVDRFGASSYNKTYGAVGGAAILLLFFYIDACVLLIGAEINSEVDFAVLGLPSNGGPVKPVLGSKELTDEHRALKQELVARGAGVPEQKTRTVVIAAPRPAPRRTRIMRIAGGLVAAATAWACFRALAAARHARVERKRLKLLFPETYNALAPAEPASQGD